MFSMAMWMAALVAPIQILAGDTQGLNTLKYQPVKVLAMEGDFDSSPSGAPLVLFGLPSNLDASVHDLVEIPKLGSLILEHDPSHPLPGLKDFPRNRWPTVAIVFWSFRIMVGLGIAMLSLGLWSLVARARGRLYESTLLHRAAVLMGPAGFVAVIAGWVTTEVGRQPYTVYGQLLTADSISPLAVPAVATSLVVFVVVYFAVFGAGAAYLVRMMGRLPGAQEGEPPHIPQHAAGITPASAISPAAPTGGAPSGGGAR
jgi:cytochrome d ubiquinol oxidase subunit I